MDSRTTGHSSRLLLDIGGTFIKTGVAGPSGSIFPESLFSTPTCSDGTKGQIAAALRETVERGFAFMRKRGLSPAGIGVAIPGPFDYANGVSLMKHKFQSLYGESLRDMIYEIPGVGDIPVCFLHDVNAVLLGELHAGNAEGFSNAAVVTLGTGLGFSYSMDSVIQCSPAGSPRIPLYNIPFRDGILEDYVSKRGFLKIYGGLSGQADTGITVVQIAGLAANGDKAALATFAEAGGILACAIKDVLRELEVECLLLGGQISRSFPLMEQSLRGGLSGISGLRRVCPVRNIGEAAFYGLLKHLKENI